MMDNIHFRQKLYDYLKLSFILIGLFVTSQSQAQKNTGFKLTGKIYEQDGLKLVPLPYATISLNDYAINTVTGPDGAYVLEGIPSGKTTLTVQFLGKVTFSTIIDMKKDSKLDVTLKDEDFKIKEIVVTAEANKAGQSTASKISRTAMDHLQATSLDDVLSLIPGGLMQNQTLNQASQINLRNISSSTQTMDMNGLGTAIIRDGAPISNNANLQTLSPTVSGSTSALAGGASAGGGIDVRTISVENIESVEVIRGIPSVEYGDLTSGAVIINSKAGREPLRINGKVNLNVYQISAGTGFELGKNKGALNVSGDYAYNINDPIQSYIYYQRATAKILYSNLLFNKKLRSNTSLDFIYGKNTRKANPDDEVNRIAENGKSIGITLNTNGLYTFKDMWLKSIRYVASFNYLSKQSHYEEQYTAANAPYSMTTTDGAILSNIAGKHIYDKDGNEITHFSGADTDNYAVYLPSTYFGQYNIDGREINAFAKLSANFFKKLGSINNRILIGMDFKTDGNVGNGKTFDPTTPPYRNLSSTNASYRPRKYKDIPFVNQLGIFLEENFNWHIGDRELNIQAGVRYDNVSTVNNVITPRINASFDVIPGYFTLRGGYGITTKMPTTLYLNPENAYFEYINMNELASSDTDTEKLFLTTTKIYESTNKNLKVAKNKKAEIGFDLKVGQVRLGVTAFQEKMNNGYSLANTLETYKPFTYNEYERDANQNIVLKTSNKILSSFYTPTNNRTLNTKGIEFDLNLGRIDAIRTSFSLNGAWMQSESYNNDYRFYDISGSGGSGRLNIALYEKGMEKYNQERISTALRITHNIPSIGFVVTLTAQTIWKEANWYKFGNDSIPIGYVGQEDAQVHWFKENQYTTRQELTDAGYGYMLRTVEEKKYIKESYSPLFCFNFNLTKEISDYLRISFFANNMFRSYPIADSKRNPGSYTRRNNKFFFGLELSLLLK